MKALILNSGKGSRMGDLTKNHPKCMTEIASMETILSRQLRQIEDYGIKEVVITTGPFEDKLIHYVESLGLDLEYSFVRNPLFAETNYIYSIYLAREVLKDTDLLLMHGDLVVENDVFFDFMEQEGSLMAAVPRSFRRRTLRRKSRTEKLRGWAFIVLSMPSVRSRSISLRRRTGGFGSPQSAHFVRERMRVRRIGRSCMRKKP